MQIYLLSIWMTLLILSGCTETQPPAQNAMVPPLVSAAEFGNLITLRQLIDDDSPVDVRDSCRWTPLMKAALNGHLEVARHLILAGALVDLTDKGGYSAMMLAASNNHSQLVELLLEHGANIDQVETTGGFTALIWAAKLGHLETVRVLLHHRADSTLTDLRGKRAIDWARAGQFDAIATLLDTADG